MMPEDTKLYVKIACSVCRGLTRGCPYCDEQGKHFVEASDKSISHWLMRQEKDEKEKFRKALEDV